MPTEEKSAEDKTSAPAASRREDGRRSKRDTSVPFDPAKSSLEIVEESDGPTSSRRRSSRETRRRRSGGDKAGDRKKSIDATDDRPKLEGIFDNESGDDSDSDIFDVGDTDPPSPRLDGGGGRRRRSSQSAETPTPGGRRISSGSRSKDRVPPRKSASQERRQSKQQRGRRTGDSAGPPSLSQTQHAARSLSAIGLGGGGSERPRTRAQLKEQGRVREWASFCRRKTYLSLEDLSREERPRVARKGAVTPFSLQLTKVDGWRVPSVLVERASAAGHRLRFSLSVSFYHAGSKRFFGDTFMGELLDEDDDDRVEVVSERRQGASSSTMKGSSTKRNSLSKAKNTRGKKGRGSHRARGGVGDDEDDDSSDDDADDEDQEMEVATRHEELVYWYTRFEDPNCIAVVELVATVMDTRNGIQAGQYGCGWTFIQFFGPNEPEAMQHRDVYRGSPRNLLFFEQGDWGSVGETVIPGCSLWFTLSVWDSLLKARHLFRPDELISATDVLPGMQTKQITVPDKPTKVGPFLGLKVDEISTPSSRRRRGGGRGDGSEGERRWILGPVRPRLAACLEFRLSELRVIIPGRESYERSLLRHLGEDIPDQEIVKTTTHHHTLGFSTTQREIVASSTGGGGGKGEGRSGGKQRAKIVDRRAKLGFHNGHTLVLPHEWVETHLEETDEPDVLMLPEEVSSLNVDGYVAHPLFALVVLVEYTIRTRPKAVGHGGGGRVRKGDPLSQAQAELTHSALPVVVGMQVFLPHDGKRLRLRNTPRGEDSMDIRLRLAADKNVRLVTTELVYTNKNHLLDEAHGGASDDEDGRGPKMIFFDLKAYDSQGKMLDDETPVSADESPLEADWGGPLTQDAADSSSDGTTCSSVDSTSSESSTADSSSSESDDRVTEVEKPKLPAKRKPVKAKRKRRPPPDKCSDEDSSEESASPSLVQGDSDASSLRHRRPRPAKKKRNAQVQATDKEWDGWRKNIRVPRRSETLLGQTLQAPLHVEASAQTAAGGSERERELGFHEPQAVLVGGFAPLPHGLSRASRTRLSRHGFTDVMKDTVDSFAQTMPGYDDHQRIPIDLDLEVTDPLAKHEITLQFAAFRSLPSGGGGVGIGARVDDGGRYRGGSAGGGGGDGAAIPTSVYFTYQFYTCQSTRTERMLLRSDAPKDRLYQAEGGGESRLSILVRDGRRGREEPSLGLRHTIDTTTLQPFEAQEFATYMAGSTLFVDVWDADALMHMGTLGIPLRALMRQQKGVVKTAMEYEVVASTAAAEDCGSGGAVAVKHGSTGKGPVVGLVQILASNYGEPGIGGDLPASGAVPGTVHPVLAGPSMSSDWRMASAPAGTVSGARGTRPRHKVRARPLSDTNPEISKYMEAVSGPGAGSGMAIASLGRRGRGDVDADSMGYDELMLLVRRFRGSTKGTVRYQGPLLKLLDVPGRKQLEQRLVRAIERSERSGLGLAEAFRAMDQHGTGEISIHDLEEMFWGMLSPTEMARVHLRALVRSMDPGGTGKIGLRELVTFVRARQGGGGARKAARAAETGLKRALARAELGGSSVDDACSLADANGRGSLSHAEFWEAIRSLGGVPGLVKSDLDPLLRRLDTTGDGRVSLPALMRWAGRKWSPPFAVENSARKKILKAEAAALRDGRKGAVSIEGAFAGARNLSDALTALQNVHLTIREMAALRKRFEANTGGGMDVPAAMRFFGRGEQLERRATSGHADGRGGASATARGRREDKAREGNAIPANQRKDCDEERSASEAERKLKNIVMKAESMGISLAEIFGVFDKDGSGFITAAELEEGLRELRVFDTVPKDQVLSLVRKLKSVSPRSSTGRRHSSGSYGGSDDGGSEDLILSAEEFVRSVGGEYEATEAAQGRLRRVLHLSEEKEGVTLEAAFGALDKNGTGNISTADLEEGLRQLKVFDGMSKEQASLATRRFDQNGDGTVSLSDFLAFAGRPYAAHDRPLEAKLRRVLLKAEAMGTSMEEAFQHFDKDGCGSITAEGFSTGLREMGIFQEFSQEEVDEVISGFGGDGNDTVSLPKFLRFLGKEYGRGTGGWKAGDTGRGGRAAGRSLAGRLRLILKKARELGTPLSASFDGFGADESGRVSAQKLHAALKDIGQFRWTTLGEVKAFISLLQDDDGDDAVTTAQGTAGPPTTTSSSPPSSRPEISLTLPALEAFVEGGDDFLARKERAALARRESRDATPAASHDDAEPAAEGEEQAAGEGAPAFRPRADSWAAEGDPDGDGGGAHGGQGGREGLLLERLKGALSRAAASAASAAGDNGEGGGDGDSMGPCTDGVRGHLDSFDVDDDGVLLPDELVAALRSLGARGGEFFGRTGVDALISRFRSGGGGGTGTLNGASVVKIAWWYDEHESGGPRSARAVAGRRGSGGDGLDPNTVPGTRTGKHDGDAGANVGDFEAGDALRRAVRLAEAKGTTLERTFARLDEDGDGFITLRQLLRGLDQLGVFEQASRDDVLDALDELEADRRQMLNRHPLVGRRSEESKDGGEAGGGNGGVDLVAFIRLMRQRPRQSRGAEEDVEEQEEKGGEDGGVGRKPENEDEAAYEFSLDPDTKAAEKKLRRIVAKQARLGVDVEGVFRRHDPEQSGSILRSDFVQAVMELGVGLLDGSNSRRRHRLANSMEALDPVRQRQLGQLARTKGPVERRLMRMRQTRRSLFEGGARGGGGGGDGEAKGSDGNTRWFEGGDEGLALIQWYREGQKKSLVRQILATSLTTEYNIFFAFASPLFFEHPLRNPFNHEERFRIDLDDHQLRVVTGASEWAYLRRHVPPCVGDIGESPLETDFFDVDPERGVEITLMAHEVVFIPFAFLSLEPRRPAPTPSARSKRSSGASDGGGAGFAERSVVVAFVSTSHGHIVSVLQVHLQRRAFVVNRTFRFYQNEGEILKRSIQLLPGGGSGQRLSKLGRGSLGVGGVAREPRGVPGDGGAKYVHCVEEPIQGQGCGREDGAGGGVVIEWVRRAGAVGSGRGGSVDVQEVVVKCRVGQFPSRRGFYLLVYDDHYQGSLYETWHVIVEARLRMDVHSLLGQQSPADLVVRGDRYSRTVRAFSSFPAEVSFEPENAFQLVPGAYNRVEMRFRPLSTGSRKIHVHLVDVDSMEIVGAWLATATAMPPVVTKSYEVELPVGRACHKRIAYSNPWNSTRLFRLVSSDPRILRPRYETLEVAGGGTGFLRLWFAAPEGPGAMKEAFLFVNDSKGQNEECLLISMRGC